MQHQHHAAQENATDAYTPLLEPEAPTLEGRPRHQPIKTRIEATPPGQNSQAWSQPNSIIQMNPHLSQTASLGQSIRRIGRTRPMFNGQTALPMQVLDIVGPQLHDPTKQTFHRGDRNRRPVRHCTGVASRCLWSWLACL